MPGLAPELEIKPRKRLSIAISALKAAIVGPSRFFPIGPQIHPFLFLRELFEAEKRETRS